MKKLIIDFIWFIAFIITSPLIALSLIGTKILKTDELFLLGSQILSLVPALLGAYLRSAFYKCTLDEFHLQGYILFGGLISKRQTRIGKNFGIGAYSLIGYAHIGDKVAIGNKVSILSGRHQHNFDDPEVGILEKDGVYACVTIGDNVFIGENSVIMANIGEKSIIGAGSVVVKDIPPYSVAVGNPAKVIKSRK